MPSETTEKSLINFARENSLNESENHDRFIENVKGNIRTVTVEPLMVFFIIIVYLQSYVMSQYIYFRIQKDYNISPNDTLAHVCKPDQNHTDQELTDRIQSLNAQYNIYIQLGSCICTVLTAPFYCVFSDRYGRKTMFLIPSIGIFLKSLFEVLIQVFNWPIYSFILTEGLYGLFGGFPFVSGLSYSYIADISTQKMRTKRIAIVGIIVAIGALCVSLVAGVWITYAGYLQPYIFTSGVASLCVLYSIFGLQEPPKSYDSKTRFASPLHQIKRLFTVYMNRTKTQSALLITVVIMFNFYYVSEMSNMGLSNTYLMSYPICMNSMEMSLFGFLNMLVINIGVGISVLVLTRCFNDLFLVFICLLSGMSFSIQMGFAADKISVYIGLLVIFSFIWHTDRYAFLTGDISSILFIIILPKQ